MQRRSRGWKIAAAAFIGLQFTCFVALWSLLNRTPSASPSVCVAESLVSDSSLDKVVVYFKQDESEALDYLMTKFRVASTEVKRQVLRGKGEHVVTTPQQNAQCQANLIVATYNLWNINPPWPKRMEKIVELLKKTKAGILGVQEIRHFGGKNQLEMLREKVPEYKFLMYERVQDEVVGEEEGIGILSQYPILETSAISLSSTNRKCLRALIDTPNGKINFFVVHLGLEDLEQCEHTVILWNFMNMFPRTIPQILVGDMNTYFDFEWPVDILTHGLAPFMLGSFNPCSSVLERLINSTTALKQLQENLHTQQRVKYPLLPDLLSLKISQLRPLKDVWETIYPPFSIQTTHHKDQRWWGEWAAPAGHTFSNFGNQDPSRTDRMYLANNDLGGAHSNMRICDVSLFGGEPLEHLHEGKVMFPSDHKGVVGYFLYEK